VLLVMKPDSATGEHFGTGPARRRRWWSGRARRRGVEGDPAWTVADALAAAYTGRPYPREQEPVIALVEADRRTIGIR